MPFVQPKKWPHAPGDLYRLGVQKVQAFCAKNEIACPEFSAEPMGEWPYDVCAYYRPQTIHICLGYCGRPCPDETNRNWTWPGSTTDREPYGVIAHELGHHCDWTASDQKGAYFGSYGIKLQETSQEKPISGYCPNPAEWFAEMFRLFVTNPGLLQCLRPKTYTLLLERWKPLGPMDWRKALGANVPPRVVKSLINKGAK